MIIEALQQHSVCSTVHRCHVSDIASLLVCGTGRFGWNELAVKPIPAVKGLSEEPAAKMSCLVGILNSGGHSAPI